MSALDYKGFDFEITHKIEGTDARAGILTTPHGTVETPHFIFCATKAAVRTATMEQMREEDTQFILGNTYHLMLQPGVEVLEKCGGLAKFTGWNGPMLTDSGGFQIFSLGHGGVAEEIKGKGSRQPSNTRLLEKITEEGAHIRSYVDGKKWLLTPEKSIEIQSKIGADIILVLDECTPFHVDKEYTQKSMNMSHRWAKRSLEEFKRLEGKGSAGQQALYGITQGGIYEDLRKESAEFLNEQPFFGHAVGGSLGQTKEQMGEVVRVATEHLRKDRPTHLLGIGGVEDIWMGVQHGIDTFDCVSPTRIARHGWALIKDKDNGYRLNLKNAVHKMDERPIDENCECSVCKGGYSRAYLNHLIKGKEMIVMNLVTIHNVHFMNKMMEEVRKSIVENTYFEKRMEWIGQ